MKLELIVGLLLLVGLAYALYTENKRRKKAEFDADVLKRRAALDELKPKIDSNKEAYDKAQSELFGNPVPSFMLDNVGKSVPPLTGREPRPNIGGKEEGGTVKRIR